MRTRRTAFDEDAPEAKPAEQPVQEEHESSDDEAPEEVTLAAGKKVRCGCIMGLACMLACGAHMLAGPSCADVSITS